MEVGRPARGLRTASAQPRITRRPFQLKDVGIEAEENGAEFQAAGGDSEIVGGNRPAFALQVAVMEGIGIGGVGGHQWALDGVGVKGMGRMDQPQRSGSTCWRGRLRW